MLATPELVETVARVDVDDIRAELTIEQVAEHYGLASFDGVDSVRLSTCPGCGASSSSSAIVLNAETQTWGHYGQGKREGGTCYGDALSLLGACAGLDPRTQFRSLVALAAELTGVTARELTPAEREERRIARAARDAERAERSARDHERRHHEAKLKAAFDWGTMLRGRRNRRGMAYLRSRGLDAVSLIDGDYVRFDGYGNPCVPLYALDGELVNVVRRRAGDGEPKAFGIEGCPTAGTLSGRIAEVSAGSSTIITEGVIDTLTAIQRWPGRLVLGAHGAGQLPAIVDAVAPKVLATGGKLVLVPDADDIGQRQMLRAGHLALDHGLVMDETLIVVDVAPHKDLNEAHCRGWKL